MLTDRDLARWRLRSQHLTGPRQPDALAVVTHHLGFQAENPSQSAWAVASRTTHPDPADLADRLADGSVIRTHVLRSTWHYVAADDVVWLTDLTTPRLWGVFGDDVPRLHREADTILAALAEGHLVRPMIAERLERAGHGLGSRELMLLLAYLEMRGEICSGPPVDGVHSYALLADRVPHPRRLGRDEALAELTLRYLTSHGPATTRDLAYWATQTVTDVKRGLAASTGTLASFEHEGRTYWHRADQEPPTAAGDPEAHLLQILDETYRGYQDSRWALDAAGVVPRGRETALGMALVDGQLVASMKRATSQGQVTFTLAPYASWGGGCEPAVVAAARRYGAFLDLEPVVSIT